MQAAEAHFAKNELDEAKAAYLQVLLLDPDNYPATLFTGDVYFLDAIACNPGAYAGPMSLRVSDLGMFDFAVVAFILTFLGFLCLVIAGAPMIGAAER